jgi:hypothetical protein
MENYFQTIQQKLQSVIEDSDDLGNTFDGYMEWWTLVSLYTERKLTLDSDRMSAISAIAERFEKILGDKYVAGLWRSKIPQGICWRNVSKETLEPRVHGYQGPSWSWAALNSPVQFINRHEHEYDITCRVALLDCQWRPKIGNARYREVQSAHITLKGSLLPAYWTQGEDHLSEYAVKFNGRTGCVSEFWPDAREGEFLESTCQSMPVHLLTINSWRSGMFCEGLVLRCRPDGKKYSSLGYFVIRGRPGDACFLTDGETGIVTIV